MGIATFNAYLCIMRILLLILLVKAIACSHLLAQKNVLTAGIQFQPIFPVSFLNTADQEVQNSSGTITTLVSPTFSYSAGMVVRWGFHKRLSLETGLNFVQRNYDLSLKTDTFTGKSDFSIIGYEHPIKLLVFVQLSERFHMNAAAGLQLTFFPSDIFTSDTYFRHSSLRLGFENFLHGGGITNLGFEYRTKKAGFFYLGATYHVMFGDIYRSKFQYVSDDIDSEVMPIWLNGSYLTFDIRYFFHSQPLEKKERTKRKSRKERLKEAETEE
jgi:hypothetical protein